MRAHASSGSVLRTPQVAVMLSLPLMAGVASGASITAPLEPNPGITGQYWRDITGTEYSQDFQGSFSYDDASVEITYNACDDDGFHGRPTGIPWSS